MQLHNDPPACLTAYARHQTIRLRQVPSGIQHTASVEKAKSRKSLFTDRHRQIEWCPTKLRHTDGVYCSILVCLASYVVPPTAPCSLCAPRIHIAPQHDYPSPRFAVSSLQPRPALTPFSHLHHILVAFEQKVLDGRQYV